VPYRQIDVLLPFQLLLEHQASVAPDRNDPLHELLDDLGDVPSVESLIGNFPQHIFVILDLTFSLGDGSTDDSLAARSQLAKIEVSLTLTNKFEVPDESNQSDVKAQVFCFRSS
jgi:Ras GTPase-activating-like protein IQGAP1